MHLRLVTAQPRREPSGMPTLYAYADCRMVPLTTDLLHLSLQMSDDPAIKLLRDNERAHDIYLTPGLSYAVISGGMMLATLGIIPIRHGLAMGWMLPSADKRGMAFVTRCAIACLDAWQRDPRFRRIEIHVRADQPWRESFARRLDMTEGWGPLRAWDELGRDYWLYARVA